VAAVRAFRWSVLALLGTFFVLPLVAMLEFSTRGGLDGGRDFTAWTSIADDPALIDAIVVSLQLAVLTSVLMLMLLLPTMVWVQLRLPALKRLVEFLCLLPLVIPAVVLVVGIASLYTWVHLLPGQLGADADLRLRRARPAVRLPRARVRPAAMDLRTLSRRPAASGAGWGNGHAPRGPAGRAGQRCCRRRS
jgi:putative spermidine/putrescine transport system permease protein